MEIFSKFGVQPILLAAQAVNFLILLYLLKRFLYKPLLKILEERKEKIVQSLRNAEEIEKKLQQIEEERDKALKKVSDEARKILQEAAESADVVIRNAHLKAKKDALNLIKKAQEEAGMEREKLHREIRQELADVVTVSLEKILGRMVTDKDQKDLIKDTVKHLS